MNNKPLVGAQLFTVRAFTQDSHGLAETLRKIAQTGYTAVQLSGHGPIPPEDVARMARDAGLAIVSTHEPWKRFLTDLDRLIEVHHIYGCRHLAIGGLPAEYFVEGGADRFVAELRPVAERLAREGMDFSYHNHNHELARYGAQRWLDRLYELSDSRILKAELDTYWIAAAGGDPAEWILRCAGREPLLHLKDMRVTPKRDTQFAEIGEGNLNWPAILSAAEAGGVEYLLVEQDQCYDRDPFESLAISYRHLRAMGYA